jgi:hypothetical protein
MGCIVSCLVGIISCFGDCILGIIGAIADCLECIISGALLSLLPGGLISDGIPTVIVGCLTGIVDCICDCLCCGCVVLSYCEPNPRNLADEWGYLDDRETVQPQQLYESCLRDAFECSRRLNSIFPRTNPYTTVLVTTLNVGRLSLLSLTIR